MKTLIENPVNFNRITKTNIKNPTKLKVIKNPNAEEIELHYQNIMKVVQEI